MKIGVDIGGTKIYAARIASDNTIVASKHLPSVPNREEMIHNIFSAIDAVFDETCTGIGVSCAGFFKDQRLYAAPNNTSIQDWDMLTELAQKYAVPVVVENDANCFALAEFVLGAGADTNILVGIILGTGVGGGIVINDKIYTGISGGAGEFGHMWALHEQDWESLISGPAFSATYKELGGTGSDFPGDIWLENSKPAQLARERLVKYTGLFLASIINALNPGVIVLGGGLSQLPDEFYKQVREVVLDKAITRLAQDCQIKRYEVSDEQGALGAALLLG